MTQINWKIKDQAPDDFICQYPELHPVVLNLLYNRGIRTQEEIDEFFAPDYTKDLHDPLLMRDMERAVKRIIAASKRKEKVTVYGDYDADGVTASVLLSEVLENVLLLPVNVYIPDRGSEGYGLNKPAIDELATQGTKLIVTCDCGVSSKAEIDYAILRGIEVVVFDHHHLPHDYSKDYIIVDPKRPKDDYPCKELAGVGVAFKFVQALKKLGGPEVQEKFSKNSEKWLLDIVAIGTIADCVPLLGENRTLTKYGLLVLGKTRRVGLWSIMTRARIEEKNLNSRSVAFAIAPRINAAGRMDHANTAYELIKSDNLQNSTELSDKLEKQNHNRQKITEEMVKIAEEQIGKTADSVAMLIVEHKNWPAGLVGVVAGRLMEKYWRPVLVIGRGEEESVGSARSIPEYNIIEAIAAQGKLLVEYGGHKQAAGFTVKNDNLAEFKKLMKEGAEKELDIKNLGKELVIDSKIKAEEISWDLLDKINEFNPYGEGNPPPMFLLEGIKIKIIDKVGSTQDHLKIKGEKDSKIFDVIGFGLGNRFSEFKIGDMIDIVFELTLNEWNGSKLLQLKMQDLKKTKP